MTRSRALPLLALAFVLSNCIVSAAETAAPYHWNIPAWAAPPIVPADNPMSDAKVDLGHYLFYDKRLSGNMTYSCASCHRQRLGFSDQNVTAIGSTGQHHPRRAPTLTNVGYDTVLTWANPLQRRLEQQALLPMFGEHPVELGLAGRTAEMLARLRDDERYRTMFGDAFGKDPDPLTLGNVTKAIASFERSLISLGSPYDRYRYGGDTAAIDDSAKRGERLFFSERLACFHCHGGVNFSDSTADTRTRLPHVGFHNTGLYNLGESGGYPPDNTGVYDVTHDPKDMGAFKAPTLRNVAVRAPYMHDGSVRDLDAVLDHYSAGGRTIATGSYAGIGRLNPHKDLVLSGFKLSAVERADLIAFLQSLTDQHFLNDPRFADPFTRTYNRPAPVESPRDQAAGIL